VHLYQGRRPSVGGTQQKQGHGPQAVTCECSREKCACGLFLQLAHRSVRRGHSTTSREPWLPASPRRAGSRLVHELAEIHRTTPPRRLVPRRPNVPLHSSQVHRLSDSRSRSIARGFCGSLCCWRRCETLEMSLFARRQHRRCRKQLLGRKQAPPERSSRWKLVDSMYRRYNFELCHRRIPLLLHFPRHHRHR
jgi:hypothetical protein